MEVRCALEAFVADTIKSDGPLSRTAIAKVSGLAKPTVSVIVDQLISDGLVNEVGLDPAVTGAGRPPVLLEFNAGSQYAIGVDIGVEKTLISLADAAGREIGRVHRPTPAGEPEAVLVEIAMWVEGLIAEERVTRSRVAAIGVCVAGVVDLDTGVCLIAPNLGWRHVPVLDILEQQLRVEIFVHNTVQAAAVAEDVEGAGRSSGDVVLLYAGVGVGAGVLRRGRIFHGASGMAGEIGHCVVPGATERCACGKIGCVETLGSATAVARIARRSVADGRASRLAPLRDEITPLDVAAAAHAGDGLSLEILARAGETLGVAASWLVNLFDPKVLVIGGGLVGAGAPLLEPFEAAIRQHSLPQMADRITVRPWALGADSKVRGAVLLALQRSDKYYRVVFGS